MRKVSYSSKSRNLKYLTGCYVGSLRLKPELRGNELSSATAIISTPPRVGDLYTQDGS